jgi:hypothetical protein
LCPLCPGEELSCRKQEKIAMVPDNQAGGQNPQSIAPLEAPPSSPKRNDPGVFKDVFMFMLVTFVSLVAAMFATFVLVDTPWRDFWLAVCIIGFGFAVVLVFRICSKGLG